MGFDEFRSTNGQIEYLLHDVPEKGRQAAGKSQDNKDRAALKAANTGIWFYTKDSVSL